MLQQIPCWLFAGGYASYVGTANGIFNKNDILAEDKTALNESVRKLAEELECLDVSLFASSISCLSSANDYTSIRTSPMP